MNKALLSDLHIALVLAFVLFVSACQHTLPKPTNANGSINPTVAVAEAEVTYANVAHALTTYVTTCHTTPSTIGCSEAKIAQIKDADRKAYDALQAAEQAVKTLPAGAQGIDQAIGVLNAALVFLQTLVPTP